jgi:hypothetical protein
MPSDRIRALVLSYDLRREAEVKLIRLAAVLVAVIVMGTVTWQSASAEEGAGCDLVRIPRSAAATEMHGEFFFVFPRQVSPSYTGCQTMWDEHGATWFVLTFKNGRLIRYVDSDPRTPGSGVSCVYAGQALVQRLSKGDCSTYETVKRGLGPITPSLEPPVPKSRDPRDRE